MSPKNNNLATNAVLSIIRKCCGIISPLIIFPYISRVLGVEMYGRFTFSASVASYFSLLAGLGIRGYAIREGAKLRDDKPKFEEFAGEILTINLASTLLSYVFLTVLLIFCKKMDEYRYLILIISSSILFATVGTDWINAVYEEYLYITVRYIICHAVSIILILSFVKKSEDVALYAFLTQLAKIFSDILNIVYIRKRLQISVGVTPRINYKKHMKPILILFGSSVSATIYLQADFTMLGFFSGDFAVGLYAAASKIYSLIKQLIGEVSNVALPSFSVGTEREEYKNGVLLNRMLGILLLIVIPCVAGVLCIGRELITLVLGSEYIGAYPSLAVLSFALVFSTVASLFIGVVLLAYGMDKQNFTAVSVSAAANIILNLILIPRFGTIAAAVTTLISEVTVMIMGMWYSRRIVSLSVKRELLVGVIGVVWVVAACMFLKMRIAGLVPFLITAVVVSVLGYGAMVYCFSKKWSLWKTDINT